jgi:hypothetical protein
MKELGTRSASLERFDLSDERKSVDIVFDTKPNFNVGKQTRSTHDPVSKGKFVQHIEVLSSDNSSDVSLRPFPKKSKEIRVPHGSRKKRTSSSKGRTTRKDIHSASSSPGSSQSTDYSYDEDTLSLGTKNPHGEMTYPKLTLPEEELDLY